MEKDRLIQDVISMLNGLGFRVIQVDSERGILLIQLPPVRH